MKLQCYLIDDEAHAIRHLQQFIEQTPDLELAGFSTSPIEALAAIQTLAPDLTFADVDMPGLSGIELAGLAGEYTSIIFTTAYRDYGPEAYEKNAVDYLLKPISYPRFWQSVEKVRNKKLASTTTDYFFVKTGLKGVLQRVDLRDLRYISGLAAYIELHLENEKLVSYLSLQELSAQLPSDNFVRIHKSFIVNLNYVQAIEGGQVKLRNGTALPVGRTYRNAFQHLIEKHSLISRRL